MSCRWLCNSPCRKSARSPPARRACSPDCARLYGTPAFCLDLYLPFCHSNSPYTPSKTPAPFPPVMCGGPLSQPRHTPGGRRGSMIRAGENLCTLYTQGQSCLCGEEVEDIDNIDEGVICNAVIHNNAANLGSHMSSHLGPKTFISGRPASEPRYRVAPGPPLGGWIPRQDRSRPGYIFTSSPTL